MQLPVDIDMTAKLIDIVSYRRRYDINTNAYVFNTAMCVLPEMALAPVLK